MHITVFGANGQTGSEIVDQLVQNGHTVTAAVRRPSTVQPTEGVKVRKIDLSDQPSILAALKGSDAVISALGTGALRSARKRTSLYSDAVRAVRGAMRQLGMKRIIVLSSSGVDEEDKAPAFYNSIIRRYLMNTYIDMARMETILSESDDLEWTSVRLSYLVDCERKPYIVRDKMLNEGNFKIGFKDAADFVANEVVEDRWVRKMPALAYP
ncbi:glycerol-3-phosphate dehydrogenase [Gracilaria domingensis]|nr:glycerol-3-phosphate dehydrogenase [Gracilaria domingensis]